MATRRDLVKIMLGGWSYLAVPWRARLDCSQKYHLQGDSIFFGLSHKLETDGDRSIAWPDEPMEFSLSGDEGSTQQLWMATEWLKARFEFLTVKQSNIPLSVKPCIADFYVSSKCDTDVSKRDIQDVRAVESSRRYYRFEPGPFNIDLASKLHALGYFTIFYNPRIENSIARLVISLLHLSFQTSETGTINDIAWAEVISVLDRRDSTFAIAIMGNIEERLIGLDEIRENLKSLRLTVNGVLGLLHKGEDTTLDEYENWIFRLAKSADDHEQVIPALLYQPLGSELVPHGGLSLFVSSF